MNANDRYRKLIEDVKYQKKSLNLPETNSALWSKVAPGYRFDPFRKSDAVLDALKDHITKNDTVLEIGGGAGRTALPLALHCKSVTNIEPSLGMCSEFIELANSSKISNVNVVQSTWEDAVFPTCDVAVIVDVTYFISEIGSLLKKMERAAKRRVIVATWNPPPPNRNAALFELVYEEDFKSLPSYLEILDVLLEVGIQPSVLMPDEFFQWPEKILTTREMAVSFALDAVGAPSTERMKDRIIQNLNALFSFDDGIFHPLWRPVAPAVLLTWTTEYPE